MLRLKFSVILVVAYYLFIIHEVYASVVLNNFCIMNDCNKSIIVFSFQDIPSYKFYVLHNPERLVIDISNIIIPMHREKFPVNFSNENIIHRVRVNKTIDKNNVRFVFDLSYISCIDDVLLEDISGYYTVFLIITRNLSFLHDVSSLDLNFRKKSIENSNIKLSKLQKNKSSFCDYIGNKLSQQVLSCPMKIFPVPIVVAIDAGHGGHDPGAMGYSGLCEKDVTIAIAKKFKKLLDTDPVFNPVMIREGDYFISVLKRAELARNKGAKILLSIHADAVSNRVKSNSVRGASVWVLSDRRADIEISHWLENRNKLSQLCGAVSDILGESVSSDPYFNRVILDLQFSHAQKVGYDIALKMLRELENIGVLHKYVPEYSDFGILRSLDIPSVLIETGFITHAGEEKLLGSDFYQEKIACALYKGLRSYFGECVSYVSKKIESKRSYNYNIKSMSGKML
ncbi:N-acetylmuramoyl-L-alanine amidase [Blochmannia endosymbiont of Polyrhachis (Hedomyrma) turneri]|uniref:N-acetylmuramoyl-L-alanine amidase n=1 Tax=Blochmannia endosymbiont of Polyrhachis (Hedomyrma) turneri TaxID=1505596 RepID=UPI00061A7B9B|nr:N-acetylmuramoyl-L-alanine amidase [Blochmannia endosymbiont of Polyrhachis (Hedomyrma) turneri]AKC59665.1 N-acetylmuramoyl-L-alanine amidase AmiB [Blochmannia endosymbiont of Polyrhachis (Hedomyrma) turneri]